MPKLIELQDGNWVDPRLVFRVALVGDQVVVYFGECSVNNFQRIDIKCKSADKAMEFAQVVVQKVNAGGCQGITEAPPGEASQTAPVATPASDASKESANQVKRK